MAFYDSLLPHIASADELDRVSTAGYALGFLGGGLLLAVNLLWIQKPAWFGFADAGVATRALVPERRRLVGGLHRSRCCAACPSRRSRLAHATAAPPLASARRSRRLRGTLHALRRYRHAFLMLVAFLLYNDGIGTIIRMASLYGTQVGIDQGSLIAALLMVQFVGIPCAFLFGAVAAPDRRQAGDLARRSSSTPRSACSPST